MRINSIARRGHTGTCKLTSTTAPHRSRVRVVIVSLLLRCWKVIRFTGPELTGASGWRICGWAPCGLRFGCCSRMGMSRRRSRVGMGGMWGAGFGWCRVGFGGCVLIRR